MIRICKKCGVEKHISNFSKEKQRKDGLNAAFGAEKGVRFTAPEGLA